MVITASVSLFIAFVTYLIMAFGAERAWVAVGHTTVALASGALGVLNIVPGGTGLFIASGCWACVAGFITACHCITDFSDGRRDTGFLFLFLTSSLIFSGISQFVFVA